MENAPRSTQRRIRYTSTTRALAWLMAVALVAAVVLLVSSAAARGQETPIIDVPITTRFIGDPGSIHVVTTVPADPGLACDITLSFFNNDGQSIHPGNDILVGPAVFADVESGTFVSPSSRQFESGGDIVIAVRLGAPDGWFSGGFIVTGGCGLPPVDPPPSTTTTMTVPGTTSTTEPPPINGIDTGGGACADGACTIGTFTLSPARTWLLLGGAALAIAAAVLVWAFARAGKDTPTG